MKTTSYVDSSNKLYWSIELWSVHRGSVLDCWPMNPSWDFITSNVNQMKVLHMRPRTWTTLWFQSLVEQEIVVGLIVIDEIQQRMQCLWSYLFLLIFNHLNFYSMDCNYFNIFYCTIFNCHAVLGGLLEYKYIVFLYWVMIVLNFYWFWNHGKSCSKQYFTYLGIQPTWLTEAIISNIAPTWKLLTNVLSNQAPGD
jgi:hypothetical protein